MKRLQGMELFVEVAKTHSFSRAAASLGIPKSTLSRQVAELERSVGLRLLSRTTRKVELTDAGRLYFERCQLIVAEAQIAHEELQKLVDTPVGPLRVNMPADFGTDFLAESFMEFSCAIRTSPSISTSPTRTTRSACSRPATCPSRSANCPTRRRSRACWACCRPICTRRASTWKNTGAQASQRPHPPRVHRVPRGRRWPRHALAAEQRRPAHRVHARQPLFGQRRRHGAPAGDAGRGIAVLVGGQREEQRSGQLLRVLPDWQLGPFPSMRSPRPGSCPPRPGSSSNS